MDQKTAIAEAFAQAGYAPPASFDELALDAWGKYPGALMAGARIGMIREALRSDRTFAMMEQYEPRVLNAVIEQLLRDASERIVAARPEAPVRESRSGGRGQFHRETQMGAAPATQSLRSDPQPIWRDEWAAPKPTRNAKPMPSLKEMADRQSAAMASKSATIVRLSKLDEVWINGKLLGDVTPNEAIAWADKHEVRSRFVRLVCSGVPENDMIRAWIKPDEADEMFRRAQVGP